MAHPIEVGKAYLCPDGLIRWVTSQTENGRYQLLWRFENRDHWNLGGEINAAQWGGGIEVEAPPLDTADEARKRAEMAHRGRTI